MNDKQYPLQWPLGWKRTQNPLRSRFEPGSVYAESYVVLQELRRLGASEIVISSNMQYKADGTPYARQPNISDTGVAVYFKLNGNEQCIPCDKWLRLEDNLRAIAKSIEALRGLDRWGAKEFVSAAFRGFKALPESGSAAPLRRDWWVVLGVSSQANALEVKAAYREKLKLTHPDMGGDPSEFAEVQTAYDEWKNSPGI